MTLPENSVMTLLHHKIYIYLAFAKVDILNLSSVFNVWACVFDVWTAGSLEIAQRLIAGVPGTVQIDMLCAPQLVNHVNQWDVCAKGKRHCSLRR
jgi:hypothetical protein